MIARTKPDYSQIEIISRQIRVHYLEFGRNPLDVPKSLSTLHRIRELIEFIPMASDEFGVAVSRINNACRYVESAEFGAAKYELRLFLGVVKQSLAGDEVDVSGPQSDFEFLNAPISIFDRGQCVEDRLR